MTSDLRPRLGRLSGRVSCRVGGHQWTTEVFLIDGATRRLDVCDKCGTSSARKPEHGDSDGSGAHRAPA
jgi:hypothetical protein